jgi:hypothetical protein
MHLGDGDETMDIFGRRYCADRGGLGGTGRQPLNMPSNPPLQAK